MATFQNLISERVTLGVYDCVVSAFAIHHMNLAEKRALFEWIHHHLQSWGVFVQLDVARPTAARHEEWYYDLWREWIAQHQEESGVSVDFQQVPSVARARPENHYHTLEDQLDALKRAGFAEVECHCRYGLFAVYSGMKPGR